MKRSFAISTAAALLALSLAGCGADRNHNDLTSGNGGGTGTTATDTMHNGDETGNGTGVSSGAGTGNGTSLTEGVAGAVSRALRDETGSVRNRTESGTVGDNRGDNRNAGGGRYTASNNGGVTADSTALNTARSAAEANLRYAKMLANARVHDRDGFLLDGENAHFSTF